MIPQKDVNRVADGWIVTGDDPQFAIRWMFRRRIPPGTYTLTARGVRNLDCLTRASLYVDSGRGFNESERIALLFHQSSPGIWVTKVLFRKSVRALRFDPAEGEQRPSFAIGALQFEPAEAPSTGYVALPNLRPKVVLNLVRLLPGEHGAGGAGRVALGLIRVLPRYVNLRVILAPYHAALASSDTEAEFFVVPTDDAAHMAPHFDWCDCYVDPLNALRPKTIPERVPVIVMLHDLQHMKMPQFFSPAERQARAAEYGYAAARATRLIAVSHFERENLHRFYGRENISVVYNAGFMAEQSGFDEKRVGEWREHSAENLSYLLYPAVPWLHKNHEILIQAIALLRRRGLEIPLVLTNTVGRAGFGERISVLVSMLELHDLVDRKPFLSEQDLLDLTMNATGMVFPSLYEGFGIPLADAMQLGIPLIVARSAATPEICGEAATYFSNPRNAFAIAEDLERFWQDKLQRTVSAQAGLMRSKRFSTELSGKAFAEAIDAAIADTRQSPLQERVVQSLPAPFADVSILVIYSDLTESDRRALASISDINLYLANIFGPDAHVTVALDISQTTYPEIEAVFRRAERLIVFEESARGGREFAVQDFSLRYDDAKYQVVTEGIGCADRYSPNKVRAMVNALDLHPDVDYAVRVAGAADCTIHTRHTEVSGILEFESRRRQGSILYDVMIRRDVFTDAHHGSFEFLAQVSTRGRRLDVPGDAGL